MMSEQDELDAIARLIWIGWDDEHANEFTEDDIKHAAVRLYAMGYRKVSPSAPDASTPAQRPRE